MLSAIVFDFDGVIVNSEPLHFRAFQDVLAREGVAFDRSDYYGRYLGYHDADVFARVATDRGLTWDGDRIAALSCLKAERLEQLERGASVLFAGAEDAIRRAASEVPIAIASGALRSEILRVLDSAGLTSLFGAIVAARDGVAGKPAPDSYLRALVLLAATAGRILNPRECVAIEDSRLGLAAAQAAGLRTIAVTTSYAATELPAADLLIAGIDALDISALRSLCAPR
jgi:HAD superfamily hydrolase (TIGR01509 family)